MQPNDLDPINQAIQDLVVYRYSASAKTHYEARRHHQEQEPRPKTYAWGLELLLFKSRVEMVHTQNTKSWDQQVSIAAETYYAPRTLPRSVTFTKVTHSISPLD